jgi:hypothetical protein
MIYNYILVVLITAIALLCTSRYDDNKPEQYSKEDWWILIALSGLFPLGIAGFVMFWADTIGAGFLVKERKWFWVKSPR